MLKQRGRIARQFRRSPLTLVMCAYLIVLLLLVALGDLAAPQDPNDQNLRLRLENPSSSHWLGTDFFGRDTASRLIVACRLAVLASGLGLLITLTLGVPIGLLAGYRGGLLDVVFGRVADGLLSVPALILAMAILGVTGGGIVNAMIAIGIILAPNFYRLANGLARSIASESYIEAARAEGLSSTRILLRHVLPNASGPLLVQSSFALGTIIAAESGLSFLGLGVQPPSASWGSMLREAFRTIHTNVFQIIPPAAMITLTILAVAVLGDALRDALGRGSERHR